MLRKLKFITLFFLSIGYAYSQVDLTSNLVASYTFDLANGANDISGNGLNGTILGVVTLTTDRFGNPNSAYEFGGNTSGADYIRIANNPLLSFSGQSFSISFWGMRKGDVTGNDFMIAKGQDIVGNSFGFRFEGNSDMARFRFGLVNDLSSLDSAYYDIWVNYVGTYDAVNGIMSFYENGLLMSQKFVLNYKIINNYPLLIGRHFTNFDGSGSNPYPFRGKIDELKIYSRTLNSCEAYALSNDLTTCFGINAGVAARYDFCSSAMDGSGSGNNGTILGGTFTNDRFGKSLSALSVDGINDYMRVANNSSLNLTSQVAISAWFKPELPLTGSDPLVLKPGASSAQYQLGISDNFANASTMEISLSAANNQVAPVIPYSYIPDTWYHLVGIYEVTTSTSTLSLYVNGKNFNTITVSGTPDTFSSDLFVGANTSTGSFLQGTIDDIRIYNRPFYKTDVKALFHMASLTVTCCTLVQPALATATICGPGTLTLTGVSGSVEPGTIMRWYSSTIFPLSVAGTGNKFITPLVTTTSLFYTSNYYFGCESSNGIAVAFINPIPTVAGFNGSKSVCPNTPNVGYGLSSVSGTTYQWFVSGGTFVGGVQAGDTVGVNWGGSNANGKVKVLPTNYLGCVGDTAIRNVTVNIILKTETPGGDSIVCLNKSTSLIFQIQPTNGSTYTWTVINGTTLGYNNNVITVNPSLSGALTKITVTENATTTSPVISVCKGQSDTLRLHVYENPDTTLSIQGGAGVCSQIPTVFSLNGLSNSTYNWSITSGLISQAQSANTITVTSNAIDFPVVNILKVLEISDKGCKGKIFTSTITTGKPFFTNIYFGADTICSKDGINQAYFANGFDGSSYYWTSDNVNWNTLPGLTINGTAFILTTAGTGFIKVREVPLITNVCPHNTDSMFVTVLQSPYNTTITGRERFCQYTTNEPYSFQPLPGSTISWWVQNTIIKSGKGTNTANIDFNLSGSYKITVLEIADNGCVGDSVVARKFVQVDPKPTAKIINGDSVLCTSELDSAKYILYGFYNSKYQWSISGGSNMIIGRTDTNFVKVQMDSSTWQSRRWIKTIETTGQGCVGDTVKKFIRIDRPQADLRSVSANENNTTVLDLSVAPVGYYASFVREPGSTHSLTFNSNSYEDSNVRPDSVIYKYQLVEKDKCGRAYKSTVQENVLLKGITDTTYGSAKLSWNPYIGWLQGVKEYEVWRMVGDGGAAELYKTITDSTSGNLIVATDGPVQTFRIKAVGIDETRTALSNPVKLYFNDVPKIFTGFSPNGDGKNDTWMIERINLYPGNKVTIMDKWGNPVFEKTHYLGEWDGTNNGKDVPIGIYYYVIELGLGRKPLTGTLSLLR